MNEKPGVNLGVIEDMESTLLPDNHTVKARGVWLMDGDTASIFYEGSALGSVQHELSCLKDAIRNLSDVGLLFDGHDECNEDTHEENAKLMEAALDRIYELVSGKPHIRPLRVLTGRDDGDFDRADYEFGANFGLD
jgi:hypothetical protein